MAASELLIDSSPEEVVAAIESHWAEVNRIDACIESLLGRALEYGTEELGSYEDAYAVAERYLAQVKPQKATGPRNGRRGAR